MSNGETIDPTWNEALLKRALDEYQRGMPITSVTSTKQYFVALQDIDLYLHLAYLEKAGFLQLHDIKITPPAGVGEPDVQLGPDPGFQITDAGIRYMQNRRS